jgi:hypothetical protein
MIARLIGHVRGNVVAYLALFVALSGTAVAASDALRDEKGSVSSFNVKNKTVKRADVSTGLRTRLGLTSPSPPQPRAGIYTGTTTDANTGQSVSVEVVWVGDSPATPIGVKLTSSVPFCTYTLPNDAVFSNLGHGWFEYRVISPTDRLHMFRVEYYSRTATILTLGVILQPETDVCDLQPIILRQQ